MQHNRATIVTPNGARLNYDRRKQHCPDTVPIWNLCAPPKAASPKPDSM